MRTSATSNAAVRAILVAAMAAVAGCGALQQAPGSAIARYEYKRPDGRAFVRLEAIERGAPPNDHPATLRPEQVRLALASVREKNAQVFGADDPLFDASELDEIAPPLAKALAAATPAQDVTFAVIGSHGLFGEHSPQTATTGRVFVRGGKLNVILGLARSAYEAVDLHGTPNQVVPGQRNARVEYGWTLAAVGAQQPDRRGDWLAFDVASLAPAAAAAASTTLAARAQLVPAIARPASQAGSASASPAPDEARYQDVAAKLRILYRLRADGLITDEEYQSRRRAILLAL